MKRFRGKVAFLTGAAGGMGRELTRQLLAAGARLILTDIDNDTVKEAAEQLAGGLPGAPGQILDAFGGDLSTRRGCREVYERCMQVGHDIDILINNAGMINYGYFHEIPEDKYELLMNVNLLAPMRLTHHFLPRMAERKSGQVVFMCSVAGFIPTALGTPYSTSKFGIRGFGMALSRELKKTGVAVSIVYPSWVNTPLLQSPEYGGAGPGKLAGILVENPARVVRQALRGIGKRKLHIYPGMFARTVWYGTKFFPIVSIQAN